MYAYKFRLTFDEVEDFVRDYEILAEQTFKDFHDIILNSIGLDGHELASFYVCDGRWEKKQEITLLDMSGEDEEFADDDDREHGGVEKSIMSESVLSDFIEDPHQRFIFEYDFMNIKTFYIELVKTFERVDKDIYRRCILSEGGMPKPATYSLDDDLDIDDEDDDEDKVDYYDEEDFQSLNDDIEI